MEGYAFIMAHQFVLLNFSANPQTLNCIGACCYYYYFSTRIGKKCVQILNQIYARTVPDKTIIKMDLDLYDT